MSAESIVRARVKLKEEGAEGCTIKALGAPVLLTRPAWVHLTMTAGELATAQQNPRLDVVAVALRTG